MVARSLYLACVAASVAVGPSASALTLEVPPECRVRDETGFGCYVTYLAGLEQQIRSIVEEIEAYNAAHHTSFEPKQSQ